MVFFPLDFTGVIGGHPTIALSTNELIRRRNTPLVTVTHMHDALVAIHKECCSCSIELEARPWAVDLESTYDSSIHASIHSSIERPRFSRRVLGPLVSLDQDNTVTKRHMVAVFLPLPASAHPEPPSNSDGSAPVDPQDSLSDETRYGFKKLQDPDSDKRRMPCIDLAIGDSACPQKLPGPDFRFLDLIRTPGILSVVKIHALNIIAQCLATDLVAVIRRPSGFGLSTLASAVHHYFNGFDVGREGLPWELDLHYVPPNLLRGFTVLSLDLGDPSITSADGEQTLVAYLARELEKFYAPWDRILKNFPRREIKSVEDLGYAMEAILRTHGIKCLIIVDNYNHMEGPGPLGEEARKFTESLCQHARGGRLWAVLLGHIKGELDDLSQQWQEYPNRAHFALDVYDMTYSGSEAVQESMGLTLDEVNELALALGIPDVITSNSLEDRGIRGWVFSESERQWPVHYYTSIMPRKESTPRHVYSIARVFEFLRELQERQVVES